MTTIAIAPTGAASFPDGGGHWWVYLQYALGLRDLGCRVLWLERVAADRDIGRAETILDRFGLPAAARAFYSCDASGKPRWRDGRAEAALRGVDVLLDFDYGTPSAVIERVRRSVLVDIDPGLLQTWWSTGQITPADHDRWVTTGETVGTDRATFDDCGVDWHRIRPCVHLPSWPVADHGDADRGAGEHAGSYTTVTSWWGDEWLTMPDGEVIENNKRVGFLPYVDLPRRTGAAMELAAYFGSPCPTGASAGAGEGRDAGDGDGGGDQHPRPDRDDPVRAETVAGDGDDVRALLAGGWRLRRSGRVAGDPDRYRAYVRGSRGEFSCVKPSCRLFANAWISDRTLCYLASGRPAVVEHTGPSEVLDGGAGLLRFSTPQGAVEAVAEVERRYRHHRGAARELVETHFAADVVLPALLDEVL